MTSPRRREEQLARAIPAYIDNPVSLPGILGANKVLVLPENHPDPNLVRTVISQLRALWDANARYLFLEAPHIDAFNRLNANEPVSVNDVYYELGAEGQVVDLIFAASAMGYDIVGCDETIRRRADMLRASQDGVDISSSRAWHDLAHESNRGMARVVGDVLESATAGRLESGERDLYGDAKGMLWCGLGHLRSGSVPGVESALRDLGVPTSVLRPTGGLEPYLDGLQNVFRDAGVSDRLFAVPVDSEHGTAVYAHFPENPVPSDQLRVIHENAYRRDNPRPLPTGRRLDVATQHFVEGRWLLSAERFNDAWYQFNEGYLGGDAWQAVEAARALLLGTETMTQELDREQQQTARENLRQVRKLLQEASSSGVPGVDRMAAAYMQRCIGPYSPEKAPRVHGTISGLHRVADAREAVYPHARYVALEQSRSSRDEPARPAESADEETTIDDGSAPNRWVETAREGGATRRISRRPPRRNSPLSLGQTNPGSESLEGSARASDAPSVLGGGAGEAERPGSTLDNESEPGAASAKRDQELDTADRSTVADNGQEPPSVGF